MNKFKLLGNLQLEKKPEPGPKQTQRREQIQLLDLLDKCTQVLRDDRIWLRQKIKEADPEVLEIFRKTKKPLNLQQLQVNLRKYATRIKEQYKQEQLNRFKQNLCTPQCQCDRPAHKSQPSRNNSAYSSNHTGNHPYYGGQQYNNAQNDSHYQQRHFTEQYRNNTEDPLGKSTTLNNRSQQGYREYNSKMTAPTGYQNNEALKQPYNKQNQYRDEEDNDHHYQYNQQFEAQQQDHHYFAENNNNSTISQGFDGQQPLKRTNNFMMFEGQRFPDPIQEEEENDKQSSSRSRSEDVAANSYREHQHKSQNKSSKQSTPFKQSGSNFKRQPFQSDRQYNVSSHRSQNQLSKQKQAAESNRIEQDPLQSSHYSEKSNNNSLSKPWNKPEREFNHDSQPWSTDNHFVPITQSFSSILADSRHENLQSNPVSALNNVQVHSSSSNIDFLQTATFKTSTYTSAFVPLPNAQENLPTFSANPTTSSLQSSLQIVNTSLNTFPPANPSATTPSYLLPPVSTFNSGQNLFTSPELLMECRKIIQQSKSNKKDEHFLQSTSAPYTQDFVYRSTTSLMYPDSSKPSVVEIHHSPQKFQQQPQNISHTYDSIDSVMAKTCFSEIKPTQSISGSTSLATVLPLNDHKPLETFQKPTDTIIESHSKQPSTTTHANSRAIEEMSAQELFDMFFSDYNNQTLSLAAYTHIVQESHFKESHKLIKIFQYCQKNGLINAVDFGRALSYLCPAENSPACNVRELFSLIDINKRGFFTLDDYERFLDHVMNEETQEQVVRAAYRVFDLSNSDNNDRVEYWGLYLVRNTEEFAILTEYLEQFEFQLEN